MEKNSSLWLSVLIIIVVVTAGMYLLGQSTPNPVPDLPTTPAQPVITTPTPSPVIPNTSLKVNNDPKLGAYLIATNGMTLYTFKNDKPGISACTGVCAIKWPPYTVNSPADLIGNADAFGKLDILKRADGTLQVTYNSMPIYFYAGDKKPGDTTGDGLGGVWFVAHK